MVRQPAVFLLDEPLSDLDGRLRYDLCRQLRELHRRLRVTMVFVTHDQTEAMTLGDRVAVMSEGCIRQLDVPQEIYDRPRDRFVATFVGSPPMNLIRGLLTGGCGDVRNSAVEGWLSGCPGFRRPRLGRPESVELGVRPESVQLARRLGVSRGPRARLGDGGSGHVGTTSWCTWNWTKQGRGSRPG